MNTVCKHRTEESSSKPTQKRVYNITKQHVQILTTPVRIRPLMLTLPVNGHFLSMYVPSMAWQNIKILNHYTSSNFWAVHIFESVAETLVEIFKNLYINGLFWVKTFDNIYRQHKKMHDNPNCQNKLILKQAIIFK